MKGFVDILESTLNAQVHTTCDKQHRLFKALYNVACKYVEVRSKTAGGQSTSSRPTTRQQQADGLSQSASGGALKGGHMMSDADAPSRVMWQDGNDTNGGGFLDELLGHTSLQHNAFGDVDMEMDLEGAQLWDWFHKNQSIMRMLEDT